MKKIWNWLSNGWHRVGATIALTVLIVFLLASCASIPTRAALPATVVSWSQDNVMHVNGDNGGMGSGWWIDNETFITACHVVGVQLRSYDRQQGTGKLVKTIVDEVSPEAQVGNDDLSTTLNLKVQSCNFENDIAVLKRQWLDSDSDFTAYSTTGVVAEYGERVYCAGYGLMLNMHITEGHYMGTTMKYSEGDKLITCNTIFGDSGSPAMVYRSGKVYWIGPRQAVANGGGHPISHLTLIHDAPAVMGEVNR